MTIVERIRKFFGASDNDLLMSYVNKMNDRAIRIGLPAMPFRKLEKRRYLTVDGFKNWDELTFDDKKNLNIVD